MARSCWPSPRGCSPARRAPRSRPRPTPAPRWLPDEQLVGGRGRGPPARCSRSSAATTRPRSSRRRPPTASAARSCVWTLTAGIASRSTRRSPFIPVALAAAGPGRAWMLATAGDRVVLLRRDATAARWVLTSFDDDLLQRGREGRGRRAARRPAHGHVRRALDRSSRHAARGDRARRPHGAPEGHRGARHHGADGHATADRHATPSATPTPAAPQLVVDGRWCDLEPLCDHRAGLHVRPRRPRVPLGRHGRDAGREVRHARDQRARRPRPRPRRARPRRPAPRRLCRARG